MTDSRVVSPSVTLQRFSERLFMEQIVASRFVANGSILLGAAVKVTVMGATDGTSDRVIGICYSWLSPLSFASRQNCRGDSCAADTASFKTSSILLG